MKFRLSSWITALALAVAGISFTAGPATAASAGYCADSGVNVVVDFGAIGGGVQKGCGSGSVATSAFNSAGFKFHYSSQPGMTGFVCTIAYQNTGNYQPADQQCSGANGQGYWALFVASPGGSWSYANSGADSQTVSNGQTVAFAWQSPHDASGGGHRNPATSPAAAIKKPTPTPTHAVAHPGKTSTAQPSRGASPSATPSAPGQKHKHHKAVAATPTPSATATAAATPSEAASPISPMAQPAKSTSGLPWWIPVGAVVLLVIGAGYAWWRKRASS